MNSVCVIEYPARFYPFMRKESDWGGETSQHTIQSAVQGRDGLHERHGAQKLIAVTQSSDNIQRTRDIRIVMDEHFEEQRFTKELIVFSTARKGNLEATWRGSHCSSRKERYRCFIFSMHG
jgi:hypothetical protein